MIKNYYSILTNRIGVWKQKAINSLINKKKSLSYKGVSMIFLVPNPLTLYRVKTFSTKEPDTLNWIDSFDNNAIMWDVGARC